MMSLLCSLVVVLVGLQHVSSSVTSKNERCGKLEQYVACPNSCASDDCSRLVERHPCDPIIAPCEGRCMCKDGYFRKLGHCVPGALCFKSCDTNEEWDACPDSCDDQLCPVDGIEVQCHPGRRGECIGRCVCSPGFYKDSEGKCVSKDVCVKCQRNEVWNPSPNNCNDQPCSAINDTCVARKGGKPGGRCVCQEGYYRNVNGKCASKEDCGKCTNNYEVFACGSACDTMCATLTKQCPIINRVCNRKCYCQNGYARDKKNVCIPAKKCKTENSCKANEEFLTNGTACEVTCANQNTPILCTDQLVAGCFCKKGFIRDESGDCIPSEKCPVICNDNEEWKDCPNSCDDMQCPIDGIEVQCRPGPGACFGRCVCQSGYLRNSEQKCVAKDACAIQCKRNEVWNPSPNNCNDQPCSSVSTECTPNKRGELGRCVCADGFYRNLNGDCAAKEDCLKCTNNHEVFGCGSACDTTCATLGKPCPIINIICNRKCYCQNGYARNKNNVCIPVEKCTTENSCEAKEVFSTCGTACEETCTNRGEICTEQCVGGCFCEKGLIRSASGVCIERAQCPPDPTCGKNEEYKCKSRCVLTCQNRHQQHLVGACLPGCFNSCYCKEGFIRNGNYLCVPEDQCDVGCDRNEEWSYCLPQCGDHTCETLDNTPNCSLILPQVCREGCVCAPGLYRNVKGLCVSREECANQCDSNEVYMKCLGCPPMDCESIYTSYDCNSAKRRCTPGCECSEGNLRDFNNICIPGDQCPARPQCGENEHYTRCGSKCQNTCDNPQRICSPRCVPGCVCDEGFLRDKENGKCILATECPKHCDVFAHEVFAPCKRICPAQECGVRPELIRCAAPPCIPGCDCEEGFLRAVSGGPCIPKSECPVPSCNGDENAEPGCDSRETNCSNYEEHPGKRCSPVPCEEGMCRCKPGFVKDHITELCVLPSNCSIKCYFNEHEVFATCMQKCPPQRCGVRPELTQCHTTSCTPGCDCLQGYLRHTNGSCILRDKCPGGCNGDINAEHGWNEYDVDCSNYQNPPLQFEATTSSLNPCKCKAGFIRDPNTGLCVKSENCSPQCKANEDYTPCLFKCPPQTCWSILADILCEQNQTCGAGCKCAPGYLRLDSGLCVPSDQCPQSIPACSENELWQECPVDCPTDKCQTEVTPIPQCLPPFPCQPAKCKCIASYKRNQDGVCVPASKCPCDTNETFSECGCDETCLDMDEETECDGQCQRGCFCNKGFVRDEDGVCILEKDCPDC